MYNDVLLKTLSNALSLAFFYLIVFLAVAVALWVLGKWKRATLAVLKRNFSGYFSTITGYVFLCLFIWVITAAAIWPYDFFSANLANLAVLNRSLPFILLLYIPVVTMSIWSEERRQGTDELLLTIPATDFDIVLGKYLSAVAIYSVSLLYTLFWMYWMLMILSGLDLDGGVVISTFLGYWIIGCAMLAVAMIASFLSSNQTVAFILGALFLLPMVLGSFVDAVIPDSAVAQTLRVWSLRAQFDNFGRGVISLSSLVYFGMIIFVGLYLSIVLVGRRHWVGGRDGRSMFGHYVARAASLVVIAVAANVVFASYDVVLHDMSDAKISTLAPQTVKLLRNIESDRPVVVEAFVSGALPNEYNQVKIDLLSTLNAFRFYGGGNLQIIIHDQMEPGSDSAERAEETYGIRPQTITTRERGTIKQEEIFLGVVVSCGLERVAIPFVDRGIPIEYELIRSIGTVSDAKRLRLGVVRTGANLLNEFDFLQHTRRPKQLIITELEKQYNVVEVDPAKKISDDYDVLMVVQPSTLPQGQLNNLIEAISRGIPTAIFEDPLPFTARHIPGTGDPQRPQSNFGPPPEPKGNLRPLWDLLGVKMVSDTSRGKWPTGEGAVYGESVVWQDYNPYAAVRNLQFFTNEFVFVHRNAIGAEDPFNSDHGVTSGMQQVLLLYPGAFELEKRRGITHTRLLTTGNQSGTVQPPDIHAVQADPFEMDRLRQPRSRLYVLAVHVEGAAADKADSDGGAKAKPMNVILTADLDFMENQFFHIRQNPPGEGDVPWNFDNVSYVLNVLDFLAGDERFLDVRKRKPRFSTLKLLENERATYREAMQDEVDKKLQQVREEESKAEFAKTTAERTRIAEEQQWQERVRTHGDVEISKLKTIEMRNQMQNRVADRRLETEKNRLRNEFEQFRRERAREEARNVNFAERYYRTAFVLPAALPPFLIGMLVFMRRNLREQEGITRSRMK